MHSIHFVIIMPHHYVRKTQNGFYLEEDLRKAIEAVKGGAPLKPTATAYGISFKAY